MNNTIGFTGRALNETLKALGLLCFSVMVAVFLFGGVFPSVVRDMFGVITAASLVFNFACAHFSGLDLNNLETYKNLNPFRNGAIARVIYSMVTLLILAIISVFHHILH